MAKPLNKPTKRPPKKTSRSTVYWLVFALCTLASFGGGFWFTFRNTQVAIKEPPAGPSVMPSPEVPAATSAPVAEASADTSAPSDPFAVVSEQPASPAPQATAAASDPFAAPDEAAPSPSPTRDVGRIFRVQVGSYDTESSAQAMVDELSAAGIQARVTRDEAGSYHAQVGAYSKKERALQRADEVNAKGYSVTIRQ